MDNLILNWTYDTQTAIESIITYVESLALHDPNTGILVDTIIWYPGQTNPVPYEYDPELASSGFIEDLRPLKAQLGRALDTDGTIVSGSIWNIDYEFHLEEGTKAMLQPVVTLASGYLRPLLIQIVDRLNLLAQTSASNIPITIGVARSGDEMQGSLIDYVYPPRWDTGELNAGPIFNHWPRFQFMRNLGSNGNYVENSYRMDNTFLNSISVDFDPITGYYAVNLPVTMNEQLQGQLLIW